MYLNPLTIINRFLPKFFRPVFGLFIIILVLLIFGNFWASSYINQFETKKVTDLASINGSFVNLKLGKIYFETYPYIGEPENKKSPILLIHGFAGSTYSWNKNITACQSLSDCYAIDLKGYGLSKELVDTNVLAESQADMISEWIKYMAFEKLTIVGHSMGGSIAQIITLKNPKVIDKLVLVASATTDKGQIPYLPFLSSAFFTRIPYAFIMSTNSVRNFLASSYYDSSKLTTKDYESYIKPFIIKNSYKTLSYILNSQFEVKYNPEQISIPTLLVHGANDTWIDPTTSFNLQQVIKNSRLMIIPKAGHLVMSEKADEFNEIFSKFIQE